MVNLYRIEYFITSAGLFFMATVLSVLYSFDVARLNLWLALILTLILNPAGLGGKKLFCWITVAAAVALSGLFIPARIGGVWLYAFFTATGFLLSAATGKDIKPQDTLLILTAAFFNLSFITNTGHTDVQYDFASCFNYIEYILDNNFLFWQENPLLTRPSYSTYHPILHFLLAAAEIKLALVSGANMNQAAEAVQVCFCFYMLWYYFLVARILRLFKFKPASHFGGLAFVCFFPTYNAIAGFFNNDCLLLPFQAGTVYYSLLYSRNGEQRNLIFIFLFATAAALTKLSGIIVLPLTACALLFRLYKDRSIKTLREQIVFGILLLCGLAVWPLYQHHFFNIGFDFVPPQEHLSLRSYTLWERFNPLGALFYSQMFYNDFGVNLWETMTKTALFGQWNFSMRGADIFKLILFFTLWYKFLLFLISAAIIVLLCKKKTTQLALSLILLSGILAGQMVFGLLHPYMCNQDFRYVAVLPLPLAMILALFSDILPPKGRTCLIGAIGLFSSLATVIWWRISF